MLRGERDGVFGLWGGVGLSMFTAAGLQTVALARHDWARAVHAAAKRFTSDPGDVDGAGGGGKEGARMRLHDGCSSTHGDGVGGDGDGQGAAGPADNLGSARSVATPSSKTYVREGSDALEMERTDGRQVERWGGAKQNTVKLPRQCSARRVGRPCGDVDDSVPLRCADEEACA
jgi:hypothetical protein